MRLFRKLFYKLYLICYLTNRDEVFSTKIFALNFYSAIKKWRRECKRDYKILAVTKLKKDLGDIL